MSETQVHKTERVTLHHGDCLGVLRGMAAESVDAVVTDPPYGLSFMGKKWDHDVPAVEVWAECLRVLKPGGHLLAFAGTRTQHRMAVRIEDAGFEIRDMLAWVYGSGFPKSINVSKAMEERLASQAAGEEPGAIINPDIYKVTAFLRAARDKAGWTSKRIDELFGTNGMAGHWTSQASQPAVPSVRQWAELKAALGFGDEMDAIVEQLASEERPEDWGDGDGKEGRFLGALNTGNREIGATQAWGAALKPALEPITMARKPLAGTVAQTILRHGTGALNINGCRIGEQSTTRVKNGGCNQFPHEDDALVPKTTIVGSDDGRWPANLIHDGSRDVVQLLGSNYRIFYYPKASREDRDAGCSSLPLRARPTKGDGIGGQPDQQRENNRNFHPTVKPTELMRYLVRLVTPPGGLVLDPFMGSGSTGRGAMLEGMRFVGIEREAEYVEIARCRIGTIEKPTEREGGVPRAATLFAV